MLARDQLAEAALSMQMFTITRNRQLPAGGAGFFIHR